MEEKMLILDEARIIKLDSWNWTFEYLKNVETKIKTTEKRWIRVGGYYPNLDSCLKALKEYIIGEEVKDNDYNAEKIIELIDKINCSYVNCTIKPKE